MADIKLYAYKMMGSELRSASQTWIYKRGVGTLPRGNQPKAPDTAMLSWRWHLEAVQKNQKILKIKNYSSN